ncbi:FlgD immunoglobulin-like domain containing protein [Candidatus Latescibacterota bacterium]
MKVIIEFIRDITLWKTLRITAVLILISVVYSIAAEANSINKAYVWLKERLLELSWNAPESGSDHYRLKISKTNLLAEPVTTSISFAYTQDINYKLELQDNHAYMFWVQSVNPNGVLSDYSDSTSLYIYKGGEAEKLLGTESTPTEFSLSQNYPNPFNSHTTIDYTIPDSVSRERATLVIFNTLGQRVRELFNENQQPGGYSILWDGRDDSGREVSSGHYLYLLTAGQFRTSKKMIFMK